MKPDLISDIIPYYLSKYKNIYHLRLEDLLDYWNSVDDTNWPITALLDVT